MEIETDLLDICEYREYLEEYRPKGNGLRQFAVRSLIRLSLLEKVCENKKEE